MAKPGPKEKPIEQAKRDGTHPSRIPSPPLRTKPTLSLVMPKNFNVWAETAWNELIVMLTALDVLDDADAHMVETCAAMIGIMREARDNLNNSDMVEFTQRGAAVPSPFWKIEREAALQVTKLLSELGLGPSARARLANSGQQSKKPEDLLDSLLGESGRIIAMGKAEIASAT